MKSRTRVGGAVNINLVETMLNESTLLLTRYGETRTDAERMARKFVLSFCQKTGGQNIYFPTSLMMDRQAKRSAIKQEFRAGSSIYELKEKHKFSASRIYDIINMKDAESTEKDTSIRPVLLMEATRMMAGIGIEKEDAINAATGLTTIILTHFSGILFSLPNVKGIKIVLRNIEIYRRHKAGKSLGTIAKQFDLSEPEIMTIIETYPASPVPGAKELPILRNKLFTTSESFKAYAETNLPGTGAEVYTLLESASKQITRAEEIIKTLCVNRISEKGGQFNEQTDIQDL